MSGDTDDTRPPVRAFALTLQDAAAIVAIVASIVGTIAWFTSDRFTRSDFETWRRTEYENRIREVEYRANRCDPPPDPAQRH